MEERVIPPCSPSSLQPLSIHTNQNQPCELHLRNFKDQAYIVQVPRDQVYRVPPPKNDRIVEQHQNSRDKVHKRRRCWTYARIILYILVVAFIGGLLGGFYLMLNRPKDISFSIQNFQFHNATKPVYNITLHVYNPNLRVGIFYKGGHISLLTGQMEIASGTYPTLFQAHHSSMAVTFDLIGLEGKLPEMVQESMTKDNKKMHVIFSLAMHIYTRAEMGKLHGMTKRYDVTCQLTVDTLAKATRVLSQDCQT